VNFKKDSLLEKGKLLTQMEHALKGSLKEENQMGKGKRFTLMEQLLKKIIKMVKLLMNQNSNITNLIKKLVNLLVRKYLI